MFYGLAYLLTMNITLGNDEGAWFEKFDAGVLTGIAIAYDISYYLQFMFIYAWNWFVFSHMDTITNTDIAAAEMCMPSNP